MSELWEVETIEHWDAEKPYGVVVVSANGCELFRWRADSKEVYHQSLLEATRIVHCVNACAGMSDEEVGNVPYLRLRAETAESREKTKSNNFRVAMENLGILQAQLTEARGLLELMTALTKLKYGNLNAGVWRQIKIAEAFLEKEAKS